MFANLQGVRALAAIGVVMFHLGLMPATGLPFRIGASGVDLFFVLSGFIIAHSSTRDPRHFLTHRLIRVVPAYWIVTVIATLFTLPNMGMAEAFGWLVQSIFYLPGPGGRPVLIFVAWTLVYELAFYLLYWLALRFGPLRAPVVGLALLVILALIRLPGLPGPWPLLLEFGLGIGAYLLAERYDPLRSVAGGAGLLIAGVGLVFLLMLPRVTGYDPDDFQSIGRVMTWGLPAAAVILGLVIAEHGGFAVRSKPVLLLGAASYAIYLLHPIAIGQLIQFPPNQPPISWIYFCGAVAVTVTLSLVFHLRVEAPLLRWMRSRSGDRPSARRQASAEALRG